MSNATEDRTEYLDRRAASMSRTYKPSEMLSRANQMLVTLLIRRFVQWEPADRDWLLRRLRAEHHAAFKRSA